MPTVQERIEPVSVLIVDDDALVRMATKALLAKEPTLRLIAEAKNGEEAVSIAAALRPELLLMDLMMPKMSGIEALRNILGNLPSIKAIILTVDIHENQLIQALRLGVRGIIVKSEAGRQLHSCVQAVLRGQHWIQNRVVANLPEYMEERRTSASNRRDLRSFTPRELQVLQRLVSGLTNKDIAVELHTSEQMVKNLVSGMFDKTGMFNRVELAIYALDHEIVRRH